MNEKDASEPNAIEMLAAAVAPAQLVYEVGRDEECMCYRQCVCEDTRAEVERLSVAAGILQKLMADGAGSSYWQRARLTDLERVVLKNLVSEALDNASRTGGAAVAAGVETDREAQNDAR